MFLGYALIAGILERAIPFDAVVPGVKLGLANVVILAAIYLFSFWETLTLVVLKCVLTAFFTGSFASFAYSLSGSLLSFAAMCLLIRLLGERVSPIGVSVVGAVFHNLGQIAAASVLMGTMLVAAYLPILLVSGVVTGALVGVAVKGVLRILRRQYAAYGGAPAGQGGDGAVQKGGDGNDVF